MLFCFLWALYTGLWPSVSNHYVSVFSCFVSSSRNRICVSASKAQFVPPVPVYDTDQFSRWRQFNEWLFQSQTIPSFVNEFYRVFLWILYLSYSALSWKLTWCFLFTTSLEMRYLDRFRDFRDHAQLIWIVQLWIFVSNACISLELRKHLFGIT